MKLKKEKNKQGFTLIELLVVLFIIGALTGLLLPNLMGARERGRDSQRKQDLMAIKNALGLYYNDNQGYPDPNDAVFSFGAAWEVPDGGYYMPFVPNDPLSDVDYYYCTDTELGQFLLSAKLENIADDDAANSQAYCNSLTTCDEGFGDNCADSNCYFVCAH